MDVSFGHLNPDSGERFQRLRHELGVSSFGMNLIVLAPGQRGRIHSHDMQEEVFLVLEGVLSLQLQDDERELAVGELVRVGPDTRRQLVNRGTDRLVLLALGGSGDHVGRDARAWESWDEDGPGRPPQEIPLPADL